MLDCGNPRELARECEMKREILGAIGSLWEPLGVSGSW
jgi:hypothetical protein